MGYPWDDWQDDEEPTTEEMNAYRAERGAMPIEPGSAEAPTKEPVR